MANEDNINPYTVLGLPFDADMETIQAAWRRLSRQFHPDRNHNSSAVEQFRSVQEAWSVLSNPAKKKQLDESMRRSAIRDPELAIANTVDRYLETFCHA